MKGMVMFILKHLSLFLWIGTGLYLLQAATYFLAGFRPQALMMAAYAVANLGIIWSIE